MAAFLNILLICDLAVFSLKALSMSISRKNIQRHSKGLLQILSGLSFPSRPKCFPLTAHLWLQRLRASLHLKLCLGQYLFSISLEIYELMLVQ